jgi:adenosylmethionine---8-amino-7-oxononanoate aminotransferase
MKSSIFDWVEYDREHVWHPYTSPLKPQPVFPVKKAKGCIITLENGQELVDGMSSWWCAIHGYNHPSLNHAIHGQLEDMAHIMFGGLTHQPAVKLAKKLIDLSCAPLQHVFFCDSGSVAVEVAMKMAIQWSASKGQSNKNKFLALEGGYHGDTFGAMSVCDPVTGMHSLYNNALIKQVFAPKPDSDPNESWDRSEFDRFTQVADKHLHEICAVILEPIVQGAGGMNFYHPDYLKEVRHYCTEKNLLLIVDEIATGFGRTGKMFASEHANISPDIMCVGKSLTGGYMSLAATLCNQEVAETIAYGQPGVFMHGPTFMANPLACACANASIELLIQSDWQKNIFRIQKILQQALTPANKLQTVKNVRVLGAIGVVEMTSPVNLNKISRAFVSQGVWIRPFGNLIYVMPPYIITDAQLEILTRAIITVIGKLA